MTSDEHLEYGVDDEDGLGGEPVARDDCSVSSADLGEADTVPDDDYQVMPMEAIVSDSDPHNDPDEAVDVEWVRANDVSWDRVYDEHDESVAYCESVDDEDESK